MKIYYAIYNGCFIINLCNARPGKTEINRWQDGKKHGIHYLDEGSINQFKLTLPMLNSFKFQAMVHHYRADKIPDSKYHGMSAI